VEDYKTATNNASTVNGVVKEKVIRLDVQTQDLEAKKKEWEGKQVEIGEIKRKLGPLSVEEARLDFDQKGNQSQLDKLRESRGKIEQLQEQVPEVKAEIVKKKKERTELADELAELAIKVSKELMPAVEDLKKKRRPTDKTKDKLTKEIDDFETKIGELKEQRGGLNKQKETFQKLMKERKCPVCLRPVRASDFKGTLSHVKADSVRLDSKITQLENERDQSEELLEELREYEQGLKELKKLGPQLEQHRTRIEGITKTKLPSFDTTIDDLNKKLTSLQAESGKLSRVSEQIEALQEETETLGSKLKELRSQITTFTTKLESSQHELKTLSKEIDDKQSMVKTQELLDEYRTWLVNYFVPTVETIEKQVMIAIWEKMNEQFQRWFQIMIEDPNLQARIDENFTPIITQNGFDQDFESLSGGEKTSVALAYRLALNSTVREIAAGVKPNLLILDEPTDGFSKEQLFRIRDILNELKCPQVVIVSHEEELDTCADHVFKVGRVQGGVSSVSVIR
jgi:exonuclease SbcC